MCDRFPDKAPYYAEHLAERAAELHRWHAPTCPGVEAYPCRDHFHIGHPSAVDAQACKAAHPHYQREARR